MSSDPTIGVVILSMGDRPAELALALDTLHTQTGVALDTVVVGNGWEPQGLPEWVRTVWLPENVGIPEGRNVGAREARGELLFFYDDDAWLPAPDVLSRLAAVVLGSPRVGLCQPRGIDPVGRPSPRRWVPRLRAAGGGRRGEVTVFWEALCLIRRRALDEAGGWPGNFWYAHEGVDLAMRLMDAGWALVYDLTIEAYHPATQVTRHAVFYRMNARNRVWLARRNLPAVLVPVYCGVWVVLTLFRVHNVHDLAIWFRGFVEGWCSDPGPRRPMSWRTVFRMAELGRPPVV